MNPLLRQLRNCIVASVFLAAPARCSAAEWWNAAWPHRRAITTEAFEPTRLEGDDVAVVTMLTGGLSRPDGADMRVVASDGVEMPSRVLMTAPGDRVRLAFALQGRRRRYYVYFGNPKPAKAKPLKIRRGVLLEMWNYGRGANRTLEQVRRLFDKKVRLRGRMFRKKIFLGHNPFVLNNRMVASFTGYLQCPTDGKYTFCTSSSNASFLLVDDKPVVDNGGSHRPQRDCRKQGDVELTAGIHKLTFLHASGSREYVAVVAWRPPGAKKIWPIPSGAFLPIVQATAGPMEDYGKSASVDFFATHAGEASVRNRHYQRYVFKAFAGGVDGAKAYHWDFGDGQSAAQRTAEHVYLVSGTYTVRLTVRTPRGKWVRTNRIVVSRPWDRIVLNRSERAGDYAEIVKGYDLSRLGAATYDAMRLFKHAGRADLLIEVGRQFIETGDFRRGPVGNIVSEYSEALIESGGAEAAVAALRKAGEARDSRLFQATLLVRVGRILLDEMSQADRALATFAEIVERFDKPGATLAVREAHIGIGDVWRGRGDYEKALRAYRAAEARTARGASQQAVRRGNHARYAEDYLRRGELEFAAQTLDRWGREFPTDLLAGYLTHLRVQLCRRRRDYPAAAREAETLVRVNPRSSHAAELLKLAAGCYAKLGQADKARRTLRRIVAEYPESPLAAEAAERLGDRPDANR